MNFRHKSVRPKHSRRRTHAVWTAVVALALGSTGVWASTSANINLQISVPNNTSISATAPSPVTLTVGSDSVISIAITEVCNSHNGYTVTLQAQDHASQNETASHFFVDSGTTSDQLQTTMTYGSNNSSSDPSVTVSSGTATLTNSSSKTGHSGVTKYLRIVVPYSTSPDADVAAAADYQGTLALTIAAQ